MEEILTLTIVIHMLQCRSRILYDRVYQSFASLRSTMSEPYPISLILQNKPVLVIGGGNVAERKVLSLLDTGARLTVVAPRTTDALKDLAKRKKITLMLREVIDEDLAGKYLVFVATDSDEVNRWVSQVARRKGILVNCVDTPEECTFYVPSFFRRGSLTFTVSTGGKAPALAKRVRKELQSSYDVVYADFVEFLSQGRKRLLRNKSLTPQHKKKIMEKIIDSNLFALLKEGRKEEAPQLVADIIEEAIRQEFPRPDEKRNGRSRKE